MWRKSSKSWWIWIPWNYSSHFKPFRSLILRSQLLCLVTRGLEWQPERQDSWASSLGWNIWSCEKIRKFQTVWYEVFFTPWIGRTLLSGKSWLMETQLPMAWCLVSWADCWTFDKKRSTLLESTSIMVIECLRSFSRAIYHMYPGSSSAYWYPSVHM